MQHDRDTARQEAEDQQVADATAAAARMKTMPLVLAGVDSNIVSKSELCSGKNAEWPRCSLTLRVCLGAVSGGMLQLLKLVEDTEQSVDGDDLEPGDDAQLYCVQTMLLKETLMEKAETVVLR